MMSLLRKRGLRVGSLAAAPLLGLFLAVSTVPSESTVAFATASPTSTSATLCRASTIPTVDQKADFGYTFGSINPGYPTLCTTGPADGVAPHGAMTQIGPFHITKPGADYVMTGTYDNAHQPCPPGAACSGDTFVLSQGSNVFSGYQVYGDWHRARHQGAHARRRATGTDYGQPVSFDGSDQYIYVDAPNVVLQDIVLDCAVTCSSDTPSKGGAPGRNTAIDDAMSGSASMTVEDSSFVGPYWFGVRTSPNATFLRDQFVGYSDALAHLSDNDNFTGNYASETASQACPRKDPGRVCRAHKDGFQGIGGLSNVTIDNNTLLMPVAQLGGVTSSLFIVNQEGPNDAPGPVFVNGNFFGGGSYQVYLGDGNNGVNPTACPSGCTDLGVTFEHNVFIKGQGGHGSAAEYGLVYAGAVWYPDPGITICGNVYNDGSPIPTGASSLPVNPPCA